MQLFFSSTHLQFVDGSYVSPLYKPLDYTPVSAPSVCIRQPVAETLTNFSGDCQSIPPIFLHHSVLLSQISAPTIINIINNNMNNYTYLAFIIAFIWGLSPVLFKFFLHQSVPTYLIIFFQAFVYLISSVIYMLIWKRTEIGIDLQKNKNYIPFLIIIPFFSVYIANYLYIYALENKGNINVIAITISLAPVVTMIFSYFIFREMLSLKAFIGFFIIVVGLLLIFTG